MDMELARQFIEQYGYLAIFLSTVIEGEVVVLAAAALASSGLLEAQWVIVYAALGAYVGHLLLFAVGRWKGMALIEAGPPAAHGPVRHYRPPSPAWSSSMCATNARTFSASASSSAWGR